MEKKTEAARFEQGLITDEALAEFKSRIGTKFRLPERRNRLASRETITNFSCGLGDVNPLYNDEEYASKTRYGTLIAPPAWPYSVVDAGAQQGLRGVQSFHSGDDWEFYRPIRLGDEIDGEDIFTGVDEKVGDFGGRTIFEFHERPVYNQRKELVAKPRSWIIRVERKASHEKGKYSKIQMPHPWTEEELKKIDEEIMAEKIRGKEVRYWEDTKPGEELPPVVKGPLGLVDEMSWVAGNGGHYLKAHKAKLLDFVKHPAWAFRDPNTRSWEPIASVHVNLAAALAANVPYPYAFGQQTHSWVMNLLTNWMGDEGWLKRCRCEYRRFVYFSDVVWLKGRVTKKYVDSNGEYCVDIETSGVNQRGENVIPGISTVILPSREAGTWPVAGRLPG